MREEREEKATPVPENPLVSRGEGSAGEGEALAERLSALERERDALRAELARALERLRRAWLAQHPEVPEDLLEGETVEALEASLRRARALVERVRREVEARLSRERVPPGAPPRQDPDLSVLSPREKIAQGLRRRAR